MEPHRLSRRDARRVAVRAQLLDADRPTDVVDTVRELTRLQLDPTRAIAPNADLVLWSRLGSGYEPGMLVTALENRSLVEHDGYVRASDHVALMAAEMALWPGLPPLTQGEEQVRDWVVANDACRRDILARLADAGPLSQAELPDTCVVAWRSSGWSDGKNVEKLLWLMARRGEVAVAGRRGPHRREKLWDLAERVLPDVPPLALDDARRLRDELWLGALGLARPNRVGDAGEAAVVEDVPGEWRVEPALLDGLDAFAGRVALLSPLDGLVHDRVRMEELFEFEYQLEMYKPAAKRRWGYFALPILDGDRLVGKLDAKADHRAGLLRVHAVHADVPFAPATADAVEAEIDDLAAWLELEVAHA